MTEIQQNRLKTIEKSIKEIKPMRSIFYAEIELRNRIDSVIYRIETGFDKNHAPEEYEKLKELSAIIHKKPLNKNWRNG